MWCPSRCSTTDDTCDGSRPRGPLASTRAICNAPRPSPHLAVHSSKDRGLVQGRGDSVGPWLSFVLQIALIGRKGGILVHESPLSYFSIC